MNNIFVYCEITEEGHIADVSIELLTKGRFLANQLNKKLETIILGADIASIEDEVFPYGVDIVHKADDKVLKPYSTLPHAAIVSAIFEKAAPEIALFGATSVGRDLAPRIASKLKCGLTADCTSLEIGEYTDKKAKKTYEQLLYQIRPAFGGNIIATIINPETRPQMATVREGVMKKEMVSPTYKGETITLNASDYLTPEELLVEIVERHIEPPKVNIKGAQIIIAGGYGMGSKENFKLLYKLADLIGGEVGASRAAVDAGLAGHERQIGQTGITVRPKLYIACGISGAVQHSAGMSESSKVISINTDPDAPINSLADYTVIGDAATVIPKMIQAYKTNTK